MLPILYFLAGIVLLIFLFLQTAPQLGAPSKKQKPSNMESSPNFRNGVFQNPVITRMDPPPFSTMKEMVYNKVERKPSKAIANRPIDKARYENASDNEILVTWLGHSTILFRIGGKTFLTDPVFRKRASIFTFLGPKKFTYQIEYHIDDLPKIDAVILSHDHYDHLDYAFIRHMKEKVPLFYAPLGVGAHLLHWGVDKSKIVELDWWESTAIEGLQLTATPARHFTGRKINDRFKTLWCGWIISDGNQKIFFTGDSGYFDGFKAIGEKHGPFDIAFIECGQYNPAWHSIHMFPEESAQCAKDVGAKLAMPIHWGKFSLSLHNWTEPPSRFIHKANELQQKYTTPRIGETFSLINAPSNSWWLELP